MATKKTGPGIMKYAPKPTTTTTKPTAKPTAKPTGKPAGSTSKPSGATSTKKPTGSASKPTGGTTAKPTTTSAKPMQKSTDPNRYFVGEKRGTSPTQEVTYTQYQKAYKDPNLATIKLNAKTDSVKIANLTRNYGANSVKGYVKKKV